MLSPQDLQLTVCIPQRSMEPQHGIDHRPGLASAPWHFATRQHHRNSAVPAADSLLPFQHTPAR